MNSFTSYARDARNGTVQSTVQLHDDGILGILIFWQIHGYIQYPYYRIWQCREFWEERGVFGDMGAGYAQGWDGERRGWIPYSRTINA